MIRRRVSVSICVLVLTSTAAIAIFNGLDSHDQTVLALGRWTASGRLADPHIATGNVIEYKGIDQRCVLTAKHVQPCIDDVNPPCDPPEAAWHRAVLDRDVRRISNRDLDQRVAKTGAVMPNEDGHDTYRDLRVNWLEKKKDKGTDKRIQLEHYEAVEIAEAPMAWLPPEWQGARYLITGYGNDSAVNNGRGKRRHGWPVMQQLDLRDDDDGGGARMRTTFVADDVYSECYGDSGAAVDIGLGRFSAVSGGSTNHCNPALRDDFWDPNPHENAEPDEGADPQPEPVHDDPIGLDGGTVLHSLLNSKGTVAQPPEDTDWKTVGNWEQIQYQISNVCTKELDVRISGEGQVRGMLNTPLPWYDTTRLNHEIYCAGNGSLQSGSGDCAEAVHQPESITLIAETTDDDWVFDAWEPAFFLTFPGGPVFAPFNCPCEGAGPVCPVEFSEIGRYTEDISNDRSFCVARFKHEPQGGDGCAGNPMCVPTG